MRNDFESNYLAHHGILGMSWGKKNGPPYPLGASDHSAAERKAGWRKSLGGRRNENLYDRKVARLERAATASKRDADDLRKAGYKREAESVQRVADKNKAKADKVRELKAATGGKMTGTQKAMVTTASIVAAKSLLDTGRNWAAANALVEGMAKIPFSQVAAKGLPQAGKVAAVAALATYGAIKIAKMSGVTINKGKTSGSGKAKNTKEATNKYNKAGKSSTDSSWNKSSSYNKGFLDYIKKDVVKPEMVDDPELLDLLIWEYEGATGKKAMKS